MRDIRELKDDPEAYQAELQRRWSGLLSYRYIGRNHSSMNLGPEDNTVRIRHDMRNEAGGIMVAPLAISSPEGGQADLVAVPNPVIASVQILDPGFDVQTIEVVDSGSIHQGRTMGYGRCLIVDAANHDRVIAFIDGQGASSGRLRRVWSGWTSTTPSSRSRTHPICRRCGRCSERRDATTATGLCPSSVWSSPPPTRPCISGRSTSSSRPRPSTWLRRWPAPAGSRSASWHVMFLARGQGRPVPGRRDGLCRAGRADRGPPADP